MTPEQWGEIGKVLVTWGAYAILYGAITIVIGLVIVLVSSRQLSYININFLRGKL